MAYDSEKLVRKALDMGFTNAVLLHGLSVECEPELRAYCSPESCPKNYGKNWVCPPGCGTLEECGKRAGEFREGLLLQSVTRFAPSEPPAYRELNRVHNTRFQEFVQAVKPDLAKILPLTNGGCMLCDSCSYPEPCTKPELKMESLSAFGIDVGKLSELAGLEYSFCEDKVYYTALLLFK